MGAVLVGPGGARPGTAALDREPRRPGVDARLHPGGRGGALPHAQHPHRPEPGGGEAAAGGDLRLPPEHAVRLLRAEPHRRSHEPDRRRCEHRAHGHRPGPHEPAADRHPAAHDPRAHAARQSAPDRGGADAVLPAGGELLLHRPGEPQAAAADPGGQLQAQHLQPRDHLRRASGAGLRAGGAAGGSLRAAEPGPGPHEHPADGPVRHVHAPVGLHCRPGRPRAGGLRRRPGDPARADPGRSHRLHRLPDRPGLADDVAGLVGQSVRARQGRPGAHRFRAGHGPGPAAGAGAGAPAARRGGPGRPGHGAPLRFRARPGTHRSGSGRRRPAGGGGRDRFGQDRAAAGAGRAAGTARGQPDPGRGAAGPSGPASAGCPRRPSCSR